MQSHTLLLVIFACFVSLVFALLTKDDARQQTHRLTGLLGRGTVYIVDRGLTHPRVLPLLFSSSDAPSRRCGARTLSYIFNALAIAMCMSRYW